MMPGCSIRLSIAPRLSASANSSVRSRKRFRTIEIGLQLCGDHAAEGAHLRFRQRMLRMARAGPDRSPASPSDAPPATAAIFSADADCRSMPQRQGLHTAQREERSNGPWMPPIAFCRNLS